jgi:DNA mismatch repair protein MutS2
VVGLKPILESATNQDLALLDELAIGTEPNTGAAIARAVLEHLTNAGVSTVATTHFDALKGLALGDSRFRNASMEYEEATYTPTYRLILDVPGQSYGLEVAEQMGLPAPIVARARGIRGSKLSDLDEAVAMLHKSRTEMSLNHKKLEQELIAAQAAKHRWEEECKLLEDQRMKTSRQIAAKLEDQVEVLKSDFEDATRKLKEVVKEVRHGHIDVSEAIDEKKRVEAKLKEIDKTIGQMSEAGLAQDLPGTSLALKDLKEKLNVYVLPVKREGIVVKVPSGPNEPVEVQVGIVKLRVSVQDLRQTRGSDLGRSNSNESKIKKASSPAPIVQKSIPELVLQTPTNTIDLRGMDSDSSVEKVLQFIDKSLLRGEFAIVLIHGNGGDRLKAAVRQMLKSNCPYEVTYRAGMQNEGGDGVTIVGLRN